MRYRIEAAAGSDLRKELFGLAVSQNLNLLELNKAGTTLEDVFLRLTSTDPAVGAAPAQPSSMEENTEMSAAAEEGRAGATPTVEGEAGNE